MRKGVVRAAMALVAGAVALAAGSGAGADAGVALDTGGLAIEEGLQKGRTYTLPPIRVINPGDEPSRYRMSVARLPDQEGGAPEAGWFAFEPAEFALEPGTSREVVVRITVPAGADLGDYAGAIVATMAPEGEGTRVGAAAAMRLSFEVEPVNVLDAVRSATEDAVGRWWILALALVAAGALAAAGWRLRHQRLWVAWGE